MLRCLLSPRPDNFVKSLLMSRILRSGTGNAQPRMRLKSDRPVFFLCCQSLPDIHQEANIRRNLPLFRAPGYPPPPERQACSIPPCDPLPASHRFRRSDSRVLSSRSGPVPARCRSWSNEFVVCPAVTEHPAPATKRTQQCCTACFSGAARSAPLRPPTNLRQTRKRQGPAGEHHSSLLPLPAPAMHCCAPARPVLRARLRKHRLPGRWLPAAKLLMLPPPAIGCDGPHHRMLLIHFLNRRSLLRAV